MSAYTILYALNGVRDRYIQETAPDSAKQGRAPRPLRIVLLAAAIAALLLGSALALSPGLRAALRNSLGSFFPYARPVEEEGVTDQGIQIRPVAALSDGNAVQVYFAVTDLTEDRLDENTYLPIWVEPVDADWTSHNYSNPTLIEYSPETHTALYRLRFIGVGRPADDITLSVYFDEIHPGAVRVDAPLNPNWIPQETLKTQAEASGKRVLLPEQTPRDLGNDLFSLSSLGFGDDGVLHCLLRLNTSVGDWEESGFGWGFSSIADAVELLNGADPKTGWARTARYNQSLSITSDMTEEEVESLKAETHFYQDGVLYWDRRTGITRADLADVDFGDGMTITLQIGETIYGDWSQEIPLTDVEKQSVDMQPSNTVLEGIEAKTLHLSTLGCTLESAPNGNDGTIGYPLTVYLADGTTLSAGEADSMYHASRYAVNHWSFPEPVEVDQIAGIAFGQWYVPLNSGMAGPGHWLEAEG